MATSALRRADYDAVNLSGGIDAWQRSGGEVVRDDGAPGTVA
jgi:rhodanese-related sulfurtransferase